MSNATSTGSRSGLASSPNRLLGVIFGAVYVLVGLLGFAYTSGVGFADNKGGLLLGLFMVNPLHNIIHIIVGAVLLIGGLRGVRPAKAINTTVGAVYLLLGIIGLFILDSSINILAINGWDNGLHFVSAVLLLAIGLGAERAVANDSRVVNRA